MHKAALGKVCADEPSGGELIYPSREVVSLCEALEAAIRRRLPPPKCHRINCKLGYGGQKFREFRALFGQNTLKGPM
jgi:hypothetical protein